MKTSENKEECIPCKQQQQLNSNKSNLPKGSSFNSQLKLINMLTILVWSTYIILKFFNPLPLQFFPPIPIDSTQLLIILIVAINTTLIYAAVWMINRKFKT